MMGWALIAWLMGLHSGGPVSQSFDSKERCEKALTTMTAEAAKEGYRVYGVCVQR